MSGFVSPQACFLLVRAIPALQVLSSLIVFISINDYSNRYFIYYISMPICWVFRCKGSLYITEPSILIFSSIAIQCYVFEYICMNDESIQIVILYLASTRLHPLD
jgi:hypothetical protein